MKHTKWILVVVALAMMGATAGWLNGLRGRHILSLPGVAIGPISIYDTEMHLVSTQSVLMPKLSGSQFTNLPIAVSEVKDLPEDTTFGRAFYTLPPDSFPILLDVVLMGSDHTSIHQPQYCLDAQAWKIIDTQRIKLRMNRPFAYDIPAIKLIASRQFNENGRTILRHGIYVYWFVSDHQITAEEGSRLWSMWKTLLQKGEIERWAYISYFTTCLAGQESVTFDRLEKFISASVPAFQIVTGQPIEQMTPAPARK